MNEQTLRELEAIQQEMDRDQEPDPRYDRLARELEEYQQEQQETERC